MKRGNETFFRTYRQAEERKFQWNRIQNGFQRFKINGQDCLTPHKKIGGIQCKGDYRALLCSAYVSAVDQNMNYPFAISNNLGLFSVIGMTVAHQLKRLQEKKQKIQSELDRTINQDTDVKKQKAVVDLCEKERKAKLSEIMNHKLDIGSCSSKRSEKLLRDAIQKKTMEYEQLRRKLDTENTKLNNIRVLKYPEKGKQLKSEMYRIQREMSRLQKNLHSNTSKFLIDRAEIDFIPSMNQRNSLVGQKYSGLGA